MAKLAHSNVEAYRAIRESMCIAHDAARLSLNAFMADVVKAARAKWEAAGGCKKCNGAGRVITWSTLDGEAYDEFGPCPDCGGARNLAPDASGAVGSRSSGTALTDDAFERCATEAERAEAKRLRASIPTLPDARVERGEVALVVRGRKVQPGLLGVVVAFASGYYGPRVGLRLATGEVVWMAAENIAPPLGVDAEEVADLKVANGAAEMATKAADDAIRAELPKLDGSPKQVAWAERLRVGAIRKGQISLDEAKTRRRARWWIDLLGGMRAEAR